MAQPTGSGAVLQTVLADGVLTLTLHRPEARNALSPELVTALDHALNRFEQDPAVRAGVLTGAGAAFCAGLDLKVFADAGADRRTVRALIHRFGGLAKPLIGAVNGPAVAGGLEMALGCDFLIGSAGGDVRRHPRADRRLPGRRHDRPAGPGGRPPDRQGGQPGRAPAGRG